VNLRVWDTREPMPAGFDKEWEALLARAPHANFSLGLPCLVWEAERGRHALAVMAEKEGRRCACVLRRTAAGYVSGWPWRWQAVIDDPNRCGAVGLDPVEAQWVFTAAVMAARQRPVRFHVPCAPPAGVPGYEAGTTLLYAIDRDDAELLAAMQPSKRRMIRRAQQAGYVVRDACGVDDFVRFAHLQRETKRRIGVAAPPVSANPGHGEGWREWDLPWMWLLLAERDGVVESGLGDGVWPGGTLEARAGASTLRARSDGVFALLSLEEARRGRALGYRWINLGGDTPFKREMAGRLATRVPLACWLGGPGWWTWGARAELVWRRAAARVRRLARDVRGRTAAGAFVALMGVFEWMGTAAWDLPWT